MRCHAHHKALNVCKCKIFCRLDGSRAVVIFCEKTAAAKPPPRWHWLNGLYHPKTLQI